jgi:transcriptional regulator with XRE-family HTH domain
MKIPPNVVSIAPFEAMNHALSAVDSVADLSQPKLMKKRSSPYPFTNTEAPGATIKKLRDAKGWTAERLAEECSILSGNSVHKSTISRIEQNASYTRSSLEMIANALGVRITTLMTPPEFTGIPQEIREVLKLPREDQEDVIRVARLTLQAKKTQCIDLPPNQNSDRSQD